MRTITLATLPTATEQEVFDHVANHLLTQNKQCFAKGSSKFCLYRGENNLKCAAGSLIADNEYKKKMENNSWGGLIFQGRAPSAHSELIIILQKVHDNHEPESWREKLGKVAKMYGLKFNEGVTA